jgi:hypothetical protein
LVTSPGYTFAVAIIGGMWLVNVGVKRLYLQWLNREVVLTKLELLLIKSRQMQADMVKKFQRLFSISGYQRELNRLMD